MIPAFMATPSFLLCATLGERLGHRLIGLGVDAETAVECAIHFATQADLLDTIDGGRSVVLFTRDRYAPELHSRDKARQAAAELSNELALGRDEVCAVDIAPMLHYLRGGAALN